MKEICVWAQHFKANDSRLDDLHLLKINKEGPNGEIIPELRMIENHKRKFWITKPGCRDHKQKRDYETLDRLDEYETTEVSLASHINNVLNGGPIGQYVDYVEVTTSPYVYGADTPSSVLLRYDFNKRADLLTTFNRVASLDYETDMVDGTELIIMGSLTLDNKTYFAVTEDFVAKEMFFEERVRECLEKKLGKWIEGFEIDIRTVKNAANVVRYLTSICHKLKPDFVAIWNLPFDIKKQEESLAAYNYNIADVLSDPSIPSRFRYYKFNEAPKVREKADGKTMSFDDASLWHTVTVPASFIYVDAMRFYRINRVAEGMMSVSLENTLKRHGIDCGKMEIEELKGLTGAEWHEAAQKFHKIDYMAYSIFDTISMELLDRRILDMKVSLTSLLGDRTFRKIKSNPSLLVAEAHNHLLENRNAVIRTAGKITDTEFTPQIQKRTNWILTLSPERMVNMGRSFVDGIDDEHSRTINQNGDNDIESSYPKTEIVGNCSDGTTLVEVGKIKGVDPDDGFRRTAIAMMGVKTNCVMLAKTLYNLPPMEDLTRYINFK